MIGRTIAHYKITAKLGEGGMGEVYRATDDRLNRDVAIKLLPAAVAQDPIRLARFKREAQVLAALTHGNIAQVYGLEEHEGQHAIVLELVEGEDLAERLERGPMTLEDTRDVALQIAEALEAAHEKGIVHRDLKPANVKVAPDGTVKVLDFGLAKALADDPADADLSNSPTMTAAATQAGIILGTASYMAPEQAKGKPVDRRADVWAFGCVLYEMLSGRRPFEGDGVSEVLAHVITQDPDLGALPDGLPRMLTELMERCLRKDPRKRVPDIAVARITLQELDEEPAEPVAAVAAPVVPPKGILMAWWLPGILGVVLGLAGAWFALSGAPPAATASHFDLVLEPAASRPDLAISPSGDLVVFVGEDQGTSWLYKRMLDGHKSEPIPGTDGGYLPVFSPRGDEIAYFSAGGLYRVNLTGGAPRQVCSVAGSASGGSWLPSGEFIFSTNSTTRPHRVSMAGGTSVETPGEPLQDKRSLQSPHAFPDGKRALATLVAPGEEEPQIVVLDLETGEWTAVTTGADARFVPPGRILYLQRDRLMTAGFDPDSGTLTGPETVTGLDVPATMQATGFQRFLAGLADNGTLVYIAGSVAQEKKLVLVDPSGDAQPLGIDGELPRVSADGRRVLFCRLDESIYMADLETLAVTRVTFRRNAWYPRWGLEERFAYYSNGSSNKWGIHRVALDGSEDSPLLDTGETTILTSVGPDGTLMGYRVAADTARDIFTIADDGTMEMLLETQFNERAAAISPDGTLYAYVTDESGSDQIHLRTFPETGRSWPVSREGGLSPVWSRDGRWLYWRGPGEIRRAEVLTDGGVRVGPPETFYAREGLDVDRWGNPVFDVMPDGSLLVSVLGESDTTVRVVLNFAE
jgi:serine/threonine-protein kinase